MPATRLLALTSNALEPEQVVKHAAHLRTQLEHALDAETPGEEAHLAAVVGVGEDA